jgi:hypothetical protein
MRNDYNIKRFAFIMETQRISCEVETVTLTTRQLGLVSPEAAVGELSPEASRQRLA